MAFSDVSSVTNHFATANEGFNTTTSGTTNSGANTVGLNSTSGLTNGSIFVGVIEPGEAKEQVFTGTVDTGGSQITGVVWTKGTNVQHASGVSVVDYDTGTAFNMMRKGLLVSLDQDGTLKSGAVDNAAVLANNVVTTAKILDANVTTAKLADAVITSPKAAPSLFRTALSYTTQSDSVETVKSTISIPSQSVDSVVLIIVSASASLGNGAPTLNWETRVRRTNAAGTQLAYTQASKDAATGTTQRTTISLLAVDTLPASTARDYVLTDASSTAWAINSGSSWVALVLNDDNVTLA